MIHGSNVLGDLRDIGKRNSGSLLDLIKQEVRQGRLSALDLGRKDRLFPDVEIEKELAVREEDGRSRKPAERNLVLIEVLAQIRPYR